MNHTLYRRTGWQSAGAYPEHVISARALLDLPRPQRTVEFRPTQLNDLPTLTDLHHTVARHEPGNLWYGPEFARRCLGGRPGGAYAALVDGTITGSLTLAKDRPTDDAEFYSLEVGSLVAADRDTELAIWRFIVAYHPVARSVRFVAPAERTLPHLLGEREVRPVGKGFVCMTRLADAAGAIQARGSPCPSTLRHTSISQTTLRRGMPASTFFASPMAMARRNRAAPAG